MPSNPEPTEAEQAAAKALARHFNLNYSDGIERHTDVSWGPEARVAVAAVRPLIEAEALREFADSNRFPSDWIMFRRNDGSGVTMGDLLREVAAGKIRRAADQSEEDPR
jgi:hypothetical protein